MIAQSCARIGIRASSNDAYRAPCAALKAARLPAYFRRTNSRQRKSGLSSESPSGPGRVWMKLSASAYAAAADVALGNATFLQSSQRVPYTLLSAAISLYLVFRNSANAGCSVGEN